MIQDEIETPKIVCYAQDGGREQLQINVYRGKFSMTIWPNRESGIKGVLFNLGFNLGQLTYLKKMIKAIKDSPPGSSKALINQKYITEEKRYDKTSSFIIGKDDKQMFYLEFQFKHNNEPKAIRFILKEANTMVTGGDMTDADKSLARMEAVELYVCDIAPTAILLTGKKFDPAAAKKYNESKASGGGGEFKATAASDDW